MKNRLKISFVMLALALTACGSSGPGSTLLEMRKKMCEAKNITPMVEYTAPESQAVIGMAAAMFNDPTKGPKLKADLEESCKSKLEVVSEKVDGDTALVQLNDGKEPTTMKKIDGKWKMVITKK
ncbi:MAG: hypothetical protein EBV20_08930 [Betaproteobacteria bacterium]|jgi:hypothetical protein|nr:hypothetical protein [Betaproteobacteria bacterium]NBP44390.1 hypothetical protein [Betaproteobacteria bacterium]